jgi:hypothetical protein
MIRAAIIAALLALVSWQASAECNTFAFEQNPDETNAQYENLVDHTNSTTESAENYFMAPVALEAKNLWVTVDVAPGTSNTWIITLISDATGTSLTCTITNAETSCTDEANTPSIAAGEFLTVEIDPDATAPDAASIIRVGFCLYEAP